MMDSNSMTCLMRDNMRYFSSRLKMYWKSLDHKLSRYSLMLSTLFMIPLARTTMQIMIWSSIT